MAEQWLSIVEYARSYKVSDMTVRRRIKTGKLHAVLKDGKYYIPIGSESGATRHLSQIDNSTSDEKNRIEQQVHRGSQEMRVIKSHSPTTKTVTHPEPIRHHASMIPTPEVDDFKFSAVPESLARPMLNNEKTLVDSRALLAYCDATMRKMNELERRTVDRFKSKLDAVEATLLLRDSEVRVLKQQVEDMQVLVGILEKKNNRN